MAPPPSLPDIVSIHNLSQQQRTAGTPGRGGWQGRGGFQQGGRGRDGDRPRYGPTTPGGRGGMGGQGQMNKRAGFGQSRFADEPQEKLQISENAYRVKTDIEADEKTLRSFKSILNKMTPEKFDKLCAKALELDLASQHMLEEVAKLVFEKALSEQTWAPTDRKSVV